MAQGQSLEEAAEGIGLTLSLAKSVFIRSGLPVPKPWRRRALGPAARRRELGKRIHEHLRRVDSATASDVAAALGVTNAQVRDAVWEQDRHRLLRRPTMGERYPDAAILIGLQIMAIDRGRQTYARGPVPVSAEYWDEHRDPLAHPPSTEVRKRYGTWLQACRAAGIPTRDHRKPTGPSRRWTDQQLVDSVTEFFAGGAGFTSDDFEEWTRERPDAPSIGTVVTRLGRWTQVRASILGEVPQRRR